MEQTTMKDHSYLHIFNQNVRFLRKVNGLTQQEMANIMGVCLNTLRKIEKNIPTPSMDCIVPLRVSEHFQIPLDSLWNTVLE